MHKYSVALLLLAGVPAWGSESEMTATVRRYEADARAVGSFYDLRWDRACIERQQQFIQDWRSRLGRIGYGALAPDDKIDWLLLRNDLDREQENCEEQLKRLDELKDVLPFLGLISALETARWKGERLDPSTGAKQVADVAKQIESIRKRIEVGRKKEPGPEDHDITPLKLSPELALRAARTVDNARQALKRWFDFNNGYFPDFSWWVKTTHEDTTKQLEEFAKFLREEIALQKGKEEDPLLGTPIGRDALARALRLEFVAYTPEEALAIGERELQWCEVEFRKAAREMGCGDDWKAALAKVKEAYVQPGEQDELVTQIARESIGFTREKALVSVPALCEETWRMQMLSPDGLKTIPYAAYSGQEMMVAYPRDDMKQADKLMVMRGNNRHSTRLTVPHELVPGHHLQQFVAAHENTHRRIFSTPFYVEGWALYCELRLWELGWPRSPEDRIGMLFWRANRAARIVTTIRFHLGEMKPAQMIDFLVDRVGHERFGATSEVRRYIDGDTYPLYQAAYLLGGREFDALRKEMTAAGRMSEQSFNDAVLQHNTMPIELLRASLRGEPPAADAQPVWRF